LGVEKELRADLELRPVAVHEGGAEQRPAIGPVDSPDHGLHLTRSPRHRPLDVNVDRRTPREGEGARAECPRTQAKAPVGTSRAPVSGHGRQRTSHSRNERGNASHNAPPSGERRPQWEEREDQRHGRETRPIDLRQRSDLRQWANLLAGATAVPGVRQGKATLCLAELERKRANWPTAGGPCRWRRGRHIRYLALIGLAFGPQATQQEGRAPWSPRIASLPGRDRRLGERERSRVR